MDLVWYGGEAEWFSCLGKRVQKCQGNPRSRIGLPLDEKVTLIRDLTRRGYSRTRGSRGELRNAVELRNLLQLVGHKHHMARGAQHSHTAWKLSAEPENSTAHSSETVSLPAIMKIHELPVFRNQGREGDRWKEEAWDGVLQIKTFPLSLTGVGAY